MKYHWPDGSEFRMSKFLQITLHLACAIRGAHIGFPQRFEPYLFPVQKWPRRTFQWSLSNRPGGAAC